ncbi:MAG: type II toxin-antitoxin system VapC family toxin [Bifidobacteriaceae bacterium]|jgi:predicted nucleic acid-binding protein|nr:type II toxin-antitoxin system VapC family toxin [Bifidobacteriaceae bacterium]
MYLLDTCVVSELRKPRPHGGVLTWFEGLPEAAVHICAVTVGEIQAGIEKTRDQDPAKADDLEAWLGRVSNHYGALDLDAETFRIWARLMHKRSGTLMMDGMIAACAKRHGLTVATRNTQDFAHFNVPLLNPWQR